MKKQITNLFVLTICVSFLIPALLLTAHLYYYLWSGEKITGTDMTPVSFAAHINDFDSLRVSGGWEVHVRQGAIYKIEFTVPNNVKNSIDVHREIAEGYPKKISQVLVIGVRGGNNYSETRKMAVDITMPALSWVRICGKSQVYVQGFKESDVKVDQAWGEAIFEKMD